MAETPAPLADSILDAAVRIPDHVVYRAFVSETVILNLQTGMYHGVNPTGAQMLEELGRAARVRDAVDPLAEEYGLPSADVERDLAEFCRDLLERGLIEIRRP